MHVCIYIGILVCDSNWQYFDSKFFSGKARDIIEECGMIHDQKNISTKKNILSYADAGQ